MDKEMININANLIKDPVYSSFIKDSKEISVVNFTLAKGYGKGKEYINCAVYGEKVESVKGFVKGDFIHVYGHYNIREKDGKRYKNFVVKSVSKIENNKEKNQEEK